jgi:hypothetical protein
MSSTPSRPLSASSRGGVSPSWKGILTVGAVAAFGYVAPALLYFPVGYPRTSDGETLLEFIANHRGWWLALQTLTLGPGFLAIPVFAAIFVDLSQMEKGYAAVGAILAISCQILFVSFYPGTLGMLFLSDQYGAADPERRQDLVAAAEAVTAPLDAYNPLYETVFAASVLILSLGYASRRVFKMDGLSGHRRGRIRTHWRQPSVSDLYGLLLVVAGLRRLVHCGRVEPLAHAFSSLG